MNRRTRIGTPKCGGRDCHRFRFVSPTGERRYWEDHERATCPAYRPPSVRRVPAPLDWALIVGIVICVLMLAGWLIFVVPQLP